MRLIFILVFLMTTSFARTEPVSLLTSKDAAMLVALDAEAFAWTEEMARDGGPALAITPPATRTLHWTAGGRHLIGPDWYRMEAWVEMKEGTAFRLSLVLYAQDGETEIGRHSIAFDRIPSLVDSNWRYGACDFLLEYEEGAVPYEVRIEASSGTVVVDNLRIVGSDSLLTNGSFREIEKPQAGEGDGVPQIIGEGIPRGWRRLYSGVGSASQSTGSFGIDTADSANTLVVRKTPGVFALSAPVFTPPEEAGYLVARAFVENSTDCAPAVTVSQYGTRGLVAEQVSEMVHQHGGGSIVSTRRFEKSEESSRFLLSLRFPHEAGEYRVREVKLLTTDPKKGEIDILVNQVGYEEGRPLRFLVATDTFPEDGAGRFLLQGENTLRRGNPPWLPLTPLGRAEGEKSSDWGKYYFEGIIGDPTPGTYTLNVSLGNQTATREGILVKPNLLVTETGKLAYRFYSVQRCGCDVPGWHGPCHMDDGVLPDGTHVDVTGGFHSAGDFHKHMGDNAPISAYGMVSAYERHRDFFDSIDHNKNGRSDLLDEAVWGADWMLKMVDPKTGRLWTNVTNDIEYYGIPERDTDGISGTSDDRLVGITDPGDFGAFPVAVWAALARIGLGASYLEKAKSVYALYRERILEGFNPRHLFTALELYETTGNGDYRSDADNLVPRILDLQHEDGWYARSPNGPPEFRLVDEGTTPAALAFYALGCPDSPHLNPVRDSLRHYYRWSLRMAENPFGLIRNYTGGEPRYFTSRDGWFGGGNSQYLSTAWAAFLVARIFEEDDPAFSRRLYAHASNQVNWVLGLNALNLCMFEGKGNSERIHFHHLYAEIPGHPRGAVPGAIPNGICREPNNTDRPWFDLRTDTGSLAGAESAEPWLPHNAHYLLMLSAGG